MRNIRFSCPECGQHLDAEAEWVGLTSQCPTCAREIVIPESFEGVAERLVDRGELDAAKAERDFLKGEIRRMTVLLETEELEKVSVQVSLGEAREALAAKEENLRNVQARHESAQVDLGQLRRVILERDTELGAAADRFQRLARECRELAARISEHERLAATSREEINAGRKNSETMAADWEETKCQLREALAARDAAQAERNKLRADLSVSFDLVSFLALREEASGKGAALAETTEKLNRVQTELRAARAELHRSHEQRVALELRLASAKDALTEAKMEQDNAVLRSLVKRLNEELNQYRPLTGRAARKLAAKIRTARGDSGSLRWPWWRRLLIPER